MANDTIVGRLKRWLKPIIVYVPRELRRRGQLQTLKTKRILISKERLADDFLTLPIPDRSLLLIHSSLKSIGYVEGGPGAVVGAMVDAFVRRRGGTVMLPTFTIEGTMHATLLAEKVFDVRATPTRLGAIPEAFRRHPEALRSVHPTHSFAAIGPDAEWLISSHHLCGTSFGKNSPMARLLERNGFLMGLGTGLGTVTFYHCLEDIEPDFPIRVYSEDSPLPARCIDALGQSHTLMVPAHDGHISRTRIDHPGNDAIREFILRTLETQANLSWHKVGEANVWLIRAAAAYAACVALMRRGITIYSTAEDLEALASEPMLQSGAVQGRAP